MRFPAVLPVCGLAAGIAFGIFRPSDPAYCRILLVFLWVVALTSFHFRRTGCFLTVLVAGFCVEGSLLGAAAHRSAVLAPAGVQFDRLVGSDRYQAFATVEGTISADATRGPDGVSLKLDAEKITLEERPPSAAAGGIMLGIGGAVEDAQIEKWREGRRVRLQAALRRPAVYLDPGVGDARRDFSWRGTSLVGSVKSPLLIDLLNKASLPDEMFSAMRWAIRHRIARCIARWSPRSAAVVTAILIGDRAGLDTEMQRRLQEAGTYHVIAISGGNIAILAAMCVFILRVGGIGPRGSPLIVTAILVLYARLVGGGGGASVGRATLMAVTYFVGRLIDQQSAAGNVAAVSAGLVLCAIPLEMVDAGFALTFGATLGLIIGMPRVPRFDWMPRWAFAAVALLAASLCAEIALLPVGAFVFSRVTAAGLLLNFAAIPLMTITQISGMLAIALDFIDARASSAVGFVAHLGVRGLIGTASLVDMMPGVARRVPPPSLILIGAYYGFVIAALMMSSGKRFICITAACVCGFLMVIAWVPSSATPGRLTVTFLDVGQGDAAVVQFPDGRSLAIDAGGLARSTFDIGGRVVSPALWSLGIRRLEFLAISHGDPDHIGGAASVFRDFHPREIWEGVPVPRSEPIRELRHLAREAGTTWRTLRAHDSFEVGGVRLSVRHPPAPDWERQKVRNDDSEVIELLFGGVSVVFTGDIGREVESDIADDFPPVPIRILKVPHHGSGTSSSMRFLRALHPSVAVISAGRGNPFGHPVPAVLRRYDEVGAAIFRTDKDGAVTVETDGRTVQVESFLGRAVNLPAERETTKGTKTGTTQGQ